MYQYWLNIKRWLVICVLRGWLRKGCHVLGLGNGPMELQKPSRHVKPCGISTSTESMVVDSTERKSVLVSFLLPTPSSSIVWSFYCERRACNFWEFDTWIWQAFIKSSNYWGFTIVCARVLPGILAALISWDQSCLGPIKMWSNGLMGSRITSWTT